MIQSNWNIFKAKFNGNTQSIFEWFCYILFCKEFNQPYGIFRYKNQSAIETNPIEYEGRIVGWQAKFYDTPLSNHKNELIASIEKSKRDYPDITRLIFYTNEEWAQNKGKKPQSLIDIEKKAKEISIEVEWRNASFFESPFVSIDNELISKHFFTFDKSIFDLIEEQERHTENILNEIQTKITFNNYDIIINRNNELENIKNVNDQVLVLSGTGGVGKTALIKNLYKKLKGLEPFYIFKATEFELRNINDLFKDFDSEKFIDAHNDDKNKTIVIDSAEKLLDLNNHDPFKEFLTVILNRKWKIVFTTRNNYLEDLNYHFFEIYNIVPLNISLQNLDQDELNLISEEYSFPLPKEHKLLEFIKNPFYLNEYLKFYKDHEELDYKSFKTKLWNKNIKKTKPAREQCFIQIALMRANEGQFFLNPNCEVTILEELMKDGILGYEIAGYFITHDIYEEWALDKIIEIEFIKKTNHQNFFKAIGQSLPVRRSFRNWLSDKLLLENEEIETFIEEVINDNKVESFWKDEVLISVLLSDYSEIFFRNFRDLLLENQQEYLKKITFLLRIACKEVDDVFLGN